MTTEEILNGTFDVDEKISREELKNLIFSLHKIGLTENNWLNITKFIGYCKEHEFDVMDNIKWYFLHLIDTVNSNNCTICRKFMNAMTNVNIVKEIRKTIQEQKNTIWNHGYTDLSLEEAIEKHKEIKYKENES